MDYSTDSGFAFSNLRGRVSSLHLPLLLSFISVFLIGCTSWIDLVGKNSAGEQGNGTAHIMSALSEDGRYVSFISNSSNLVSGDTNGVHDVFVRDLLNGTTERVSESATGQEANEQSVSTDISGNGEWIVFTSRASNLVPGVTPILPAVYLKNRLSGAITLVSKQNLSGTPMEGRLPVISRDGRWVAYSSGGQIVLGDTNGVPDVFLYDRILNVNYRVSVGQGGPHGVQLDHASDAPAISDDGQVIAFTNLVSNDERRVYVRDRSSSTTTQEIPICTSGKWDGCTAQDISGDGRYVTYYAHYVFTPTSGTIYRPQVFVWDRIAGISTPHSSEYICSLDTNPTERELCTDGVVPDRATLSGDGRFLAWSTPFAEFSLDSNGIQDIYLKDLHAVSGPSLWRVSTNTFGQQIELTGNWPYYPNISHDGRYVAFSSDFEGFLEDSSEGNVEALIKATPPITATNFSPPELTRGSTTTVVIAGYHFLSPHMSVTAQGVTFDNVVVFNENFIVADATVSPTAKIGLTNYVVKLDGTGPGSNTGSTGICLNCFSIIE